MTAVEKIQKMPTSLYPFFAVMAFSKLKASKKPGVVTKEIATDKEANFERLQTYSETTRLPIQIIDEPSAEERFWLYRVDWDNQENKLVDPNGISRDYSRLKYGDAKATRKFAKQLAERFITLALTPGYFGPKGITDWSKVKIATLYWDLRLPAAHLSDEFFNQVNRMLHSLGFPPVTLVKFNRHHQQTLGFDYGSQSDIRVRQAENEKQKYTWNADLLGPDDHLIVIDDCIITGGHEDTVRRDLFHQGIYPRVKQVSWGYLVKVPKSAGSSKAEHALNTAYVKSTDDIIKIFAESPMHAKTNLRILKYIYRSTQGNVRRFKEIMRMFADVNPEFVREFYFGGINGFHAYDEPETIGYFEAMREIVEEYEDE